MRGYLVSFDPDISSFRYMLSKETVEHDDYFIFISPEASDDKKGRKVLEKFLADLKDKGMKVKYEFFNIRGGNFVEDLRTLLEYTISKGFEEITIWAVGGPRSLVTLLTLYGQLDPRVVRIYTFNEDKSREIKVEKLGLTLPKINKEMERILDLMKKKGEMTVKNLAEELKVETSRAYRLANKLVDYGYLSRERGRGIKLKLTDAGKIALLLKSLSVTI